MKRALDLEIFARTQADAERRGAEQALAFFGEIPYFQIGSRARVSTQLFDGTVVQYAVTLSYIADDKEV